MRSVHDNTLVGYEVDGENQTILLHTEFRDVAIGAQIEKTDVLFSGVAAYLFESTTLKSIIADIVQCSANYVWTSDIEKHKHFFKRDGWPAPWGESAEAAARYFKDNNLHGFEISCSYGLSGWVIAEKMDYVPEH